MKKFIGDKAFYKMLLIIVIPIIIQNGITNFVGLLDNLMVGQIGTEQMSGVAIVNQLMFVFNLCVFGAISGAGIFTAQFYGTGDNEGVRNTFRFKFIICMIFSAAGYAVFSAAGENMISLFLHEGGESGNIQETLKYGIKYLRWMMLGLVPFAMSQIYSGTLRETGETFVPMLSGIAAVFVNLILNYLLIYGKFGCPEMGVEGAAIATVVSRVVESAIVIIWTHTHSARYRFIRSAYRTLRIPLGLMKQIMLKGLPLIFNEAMWALGMTIMNQCYSTRGLAAVAALNISNTIFNLFSVVLFAIGNAVAIIIGQLLGAGKLKEAKETDNRLIFVTVVFNIVTGIILFAASGLFPKLYNTTDEVRGIAAELIMIVAVFMPIQGFLNVAYFTLRSGGKTVITFIFDAGFVWLVSIPAALILSRCTDIPVTLLFLFCSMTDLLKAFVGYVLLKKGSWVKKLV